MEMAANLTKAGRAARDWAVNSWEGKLAVCVGLGKSYKRAVARCKIGGRDIGLQLIQSKHGCEWFRYSRGYYKQPSNMLCEVTWRKR